MREAAERLQGPEGLTAHASTFGRRDVVRAWAEALPAGTATANDVLGLTDAFLAPDRRAVVRLLDSDQADVVRRGDGRLVRAAVEPRWSTPDLLALEQRALAGADGSHAAGLARAGAEALAAALRAHPSLSEEQAAMVQRLTTGGVGVDVVVGKAGAGKTYGLSAAAAAWRASGIEVVGCALAARAAAELQAGAGIPAVTIARLLRDIEQRGAHAVLAGRVVVDDEAGMIGTRTLAALLEHSRDVRCKVVLVGDPRQLPEIQTGGLYAALARRQPGIELVENRRQQRPWERDALDQVRDGDPAAGVTAMEDHGRVHSAPNAETLRYRLAADWWDAYRAGSHAVMIALRRSDVDELNTRARDHLDAAQLRTGPALETAGLQLRAGDRVVCGRNNPRLGVLNGTFGTVFHVDTERREVTIGVADGTTRTLRASYLDAGHLAHSYAITGQRPKAPQSTARSCSAPTSCTASGAMSRCHAPATAPTSTSSAIRRRTRPRRSLKASATDAPSGSPAAAPRTTAFARASVHCRRHAARRPRRGSGWQ